MVAAAAARVVVPGEAEQPLEVGDVLVPDLGELVVAVVGLVGKPQSALEDVEDVAVGVAVVGVDVGAEQAVAAESLELPEERRQVADVAQGVDRAEQRLDRAQAQLVDPALVHERRVEGADLAGVLVSSGVVSGRDAVGEPLDDLAHVLLRVVGELHEGAPAGAVGGDLRLPQPATVDVAEQVVLGSGLGVHALAGVVEDRHGTTLTGTPVGTRGFRARQSRTRTTDLPRVRR